MFDDTFLHDAANESDQVRVVLFLDIRRKMPFYLQLLNLIVLGIAYRDPSIKNIQKYARIRR